MATGINCPSSDQPNNGPSTSAQPTTRRAPYDPGALRPVPYGYCIPYHRPSEFCRTNKCKYKHTCPICKQRHPLFRCPCRAPSQSSATHSAFSRENNSSTSGPPVHKSEEQGPLVPYGYCMAFHRPNEICRRKKCKFKHSCPICKQGHPVFKHDASPSQSSATPSAFSQENNSSTSSPLVHKSGEQGPFVPYGYCMFYNRPNEICQLNPCKHKHKCPICKQGHPLFKHDASPSQSSATPCKNTVSYPHNDNPNKGASTSGQPVHNLGASFVPFGFCIAFHSQYKVCGKNPCELKHKCPICMGEHPLFKHNKASRKHLKMAALQ